MFKYKYDELINPCFQAIKSLGGSAKNDEINEILIKMLNLQDDEINELHRNSTTKLEYRSAWARTYLKKYFIDLDDEFLNKLSKIDCNDNEYKEYHETIIKNIKYNR